VFVFLGRPMKHSQNVHSIWKVIPGSFQALSIDNISFTIIIEVYKLIIGLNTIKCQLNVPVSLV